MTVFTGDAPGFGEPVGLALGLVAGLGDGATVGLGTGGLAGSGFGGSQAVVAAIVAARIVDIMNDLLIVFLLNNRKHTDETPSAAQTSTAGLMRGVFLAIR